MRAGVSSSTGSKARRSSVVPMAIFKTSSSKTNSSKSNAPLSVVEYVSELPGASDPFNKPFFDPVGFTSWKSTKISDVRRWRESELTHGRVAMLAALGFVVGEQLEDFPAFLNFDGSVTGPAITHFQQVEETRPLFWEALVLCIGLAESFRVAAGWSAPVGSGFNNLKDEYIMGDLGFDPLGLRPQEPEALKIMQTKELNNGRLAMIGIAGFVVQELVEQTEIFQHLARRLEYDVLFELDNIERAVGLPETPVPEIVLQELGIQK